ncbi:MAG: hypothetical protein H0U88_04310 [Chthoniobacterales bacterium]|nr:hypothetical protein [Chthoniobacterales bacterium]
MAAIKPPGPPPPQRGGWSQFAVSLLLALLTAIVFERTLRHDFINYDDPAYIHEQPEIIGGLTSRGLAWAFTNTHSGNWHPLTSLSHMLDCQLFGMSAQGHHFTSVLLHLIGTVLLLLVLQRLTGAFWRSAFVAAVFALHPLRVESVAWIAERKDVLSGVFFMLTLAAYAAYVRNSSFLRYAMLVAAFALGLMSKPTLVTLPFLLLLLDFWPMKRTATATRLIVEKIPLLIFSAAACIVTFLAQTATMSPLEKLPIGWRIANAFTSVLTYLGQVFWPAKLAVFYPHPRDQLSTVAVVFAVLFVGAVSFAAFLVRRQRPYLFVGWFWFVGMLVPVLGLVQVGLQGHADRYTYLAHIGISVLLAWVIADLTASWAQRRALLSVGAAAVIGVLSWATWKQAAYWQNSETLWRHTLAVTSRNAVAHTNLGNLLPASEAVPHYEKALEINSEDVIPLNNLAWVRATCLEPSLRDGTNAVQGASKAVSLSGGGDPVYLRTLAAAYAESGRFNEAAAVAGQALALATAIGNQALAADLEANIAGFRRRLPVRDASLTPAEARP